LFSDDKGAPPPPPQRDFWSDADESGVVSTLLDLTKMEENWSC